MIEQAGHAFAADLLVVGERQMDRRGEAALELGNQGERGRDEALHVGGAAPYRRPSRATQAKASLDQAWPSTGTTSV